MLTINGTRPLFFSLPTMDPPRLVQITLSTDAGSPANQQSTSGLLKEEYFLLQKTVDDFDQKALTIKAWSVTASMAAIVASVTIKAPDDPHHLAPFLCLLASVGSLAFWVTEALWKTFQQCYYSRIDRIEEFFQCPEEPIAPLQISAQFRTSLQQQITEWRFVRIMCLPHVMFPHVIVIAVGVIAWYLFKA